MLLFMVKHDVSFMNRFEYEELKYHMLSTLSFKLTDFQEQSNLKIGLKTQENASARV